MKTIPLTQGRFAIVDDEDYYELIKYKWHSHRQRKTDKYYASRMITDSITKKRKKQFLHKLLLNENNNLLVDHIDGNPLNNCRNNLRYCNNKENCRNQCKSINCSSKYKGVSKTRNNTFVSYYYVDNKQFRIGNYENEIDAAIAYNEAVLKVFGSFSKINVI